jgi:hypothetical protein
MGVACKALNPKLQSNKMKWVLLHIQAPHCLHFQDLPTKVALDDFWW